MFDEFIRELDTFPSTMTVRVSLPVDEKGQALAVDAR